MQFSENTFLKEDDIFVLLKILLNSRAFSISEMENLVDKLLSLCKEDKRKLVKDAIMNERFHYIGSDGDKSQIQTIWKLNDIIKKHKKVLITYKKIDGHIISCMIKPVGIIFSECCFFLVCFKDKDEKNRPLLIKIDSIEDYEVLEEKFIIPEKNRFQESEFIKRLPFTSTGKLVKVRFKYSGNSYSSVYGRLPNAVIVEKDGEKTIFEAEAYDKSLKMWLLSQADNVEIISPKEIRDDIVSIIERMWRIYKDENQ